MYNRPLPGGQNGNPGLHRDEGQAVTGGWNIGEQKVCEQRATKSEGLWATAGKGEASGHRPEILPERSYP